MALFRWRPLGIPLYLRIWLAVVAAVVVLTLVLGWLWSINADPPTARQIFLRDENGRVLGEANAPPLRIPGRGIEFQVPMADGRVMFVHIPPRPRRPGEPPPPRPWFGGPSGLLWVMGIAALAVAIGIWPVVRRLTQRLERLRGGVERWGAGDLSTRVDESGKDEVAALARRFNQAAERVETLVKTHKSLLANASHELRSPLARIRMGLELMGESGPGPADGATPAAKPPSAFRAEISRNVAELDQLIDEILLASRLDARETELGTIESVDLTGLAAEEGARADVELDVAEGLPEITIEGVPRLLRRLIRNLLENARRYSGGEVHLSVTREGHQAVLRVSDHGPGVPESERERIFEPFYRLPGASEREGGVGLGLALVKSITQRHGGTVRCEDTPGGGASFVVTLPCNQM